jgi:long-chain fatty acid transport protein
VLEAHLDGPLIVSFGTGFKLGTKTQVAVDGVFTKFEGVAGFGSPGGIVDGDIQPFGWRNVWTFKAGVQYQATGTLTLRAGYNYTQTPLRSDVILTAGTSAPASYQSYFCGGFGYKAFPFLTAETSVYYAPRNHVTGPFPTAQGTAGTIDNSNSITSLLVGLSFAF